MFVEVRASRRSSGRGGQTVRVVFDTSVMVEAARSNRGVSYALVSSLPAPEFELCLVTHNVKDFRGSERFGVLAIAPREFLSLIQARR